jgi:hypothetical protein
VYCLTHIRCIPVYSFGPFSGGTLLTSIVLGLYFCNRMSASFTGCVCRAQALDLLRTNGSLPQRYTPKDSRAKELSLLTKIFIGKVGDHLFSLTTLTSRYGLCGVLYSRTRDKFPLEMRMRRLQDLYGYIWLLSFPMSCASITEQQDPDGIPDGTYCNGYHDGRYSFRGRVLPTGLTLLARWTSQ